jgi:hypothetical protein
LLEIANSSRLGIWTASVQRWSVRRGLGTTATPTPIAHGVLVGWSAARVSTETVYSTLPALSVPTLLFAAADPSHIASGTQKWYTKR